MKFRLWLFSGGLLTYLITRIWGLAEFPIYFFCDEAFHPVHAMKLIENGFRSKEGEFLPFYIEKAPSRWVPQITLYIYALPAYLFGNDIFITRFVHVLLGVICPIGICLTLKKVFKSSAWWSGVLVLSVLPVWFLHSRTAFETVLIVAFYSGFVCSYFLYRDGRRMMIYATVLFAGLTFYTHFSGTIIILVTSILFLLSDLRFHFQNRRNLIFPLCIAAIMMLPAVRHVVTRPGASNQQLEVIDSHWFQPNLSMQQKLYKSFEHFSIVTGYGYWFDPHKGRELDRHRWLGRGHLPLWLLPFFLIGLSKSLINIKMHQYRLLIITIFATLTPILLVPLSVMRVFVFVVPFTYMSVLGFSFLIDNLGKFVPRIMLESIFFFALSIIAVKDTHDALTKGPTWFKRYGLYNMQYGASQVFAEVNRILSEDPENHCAVSVDWANGFNTLIDFFLSKEFTKRFSSTSPNEINFGRAKISEKSYFILSVTDFAKISSSPKIEKVQILKTLPFPDGSPGFFITKLRYVSNLQELLDKEKEERKKLVTASLRINGKEVILRHSVLDMGNPVSLFDGKKASLIRGLEANPFIIEIEWAVPEALSKVQLLLARTRYKIVLELFEEINGQPLRMERNENPPAEGEVLVSFDIPGTPKNYSKIRLLIEEPGKKDVHAHIRELNLLSF